LLTALRYLSRSAAKLSPYSSLTHVGLGTTCSKLGDHELAIAPGEWSEVSSMRLRRYSVEQLFWAISRHPAVRRQLPVEQNPSVRETGVDVYRFFTPGVWLETSGGEMVYRAERLVVIRLDRQTVIDMSSVLDGQGSTYEQVIANLTQRRSSEDEARGILETLISVGYVIIHPPWQSDEPVAEARLLEFLESLSSHELNAVCTALHQVTAAEINHRHLHLCTMTECVESIVDGLRSAWRSTAELLGGAKGRDTDIAHRLVTHDCILVNKTGGAIVTLAEGKLHEWRQTMEPLALASHVFWHGLDLLHCLGSAMKERGTTALPLDEFSVWAQPMWRAYVKYDLAHRKQEGEVEPFEYKELSTSWQLRELRSRLRRVLDQSCYWQDDELTIDQGELNEAVKYVPPELRGPCAPCMFMQPADDNRRWVVNRSDSGSGRLGSRFLSMMDPELRDRYLAYANATSRVIIAPEESVIWLDIGTGTSDLLNIHEPQTEAVLHMPGTRLGDATKKIRLNELVVAIAPGEMVPKLFNSNDGRRVIPMHLGGSGLDFLPPLARLIAMFGPSQAPLLRPTREWSDIGGISVRPRLVLGNLILSRKAWRIPTAALDPSHYLTGRQFYEWINEWRTRHGLPGQVFFKGGPKCGSRMRKPQFVDLSSPLFVRLFESSIKQSGSCIHVEEALPMPSMLPRAADGQAWAVEVMAELSLVPHLGNRAHPCGTERPAEHSRSAQTVAN